MKGLANRLESEKRMKQKAKYILKSRLGREPTNEEIGKSSTIHGTSCSCWMCGNPRKYFGQKTFQELRLEPIETILKDFI